MWKDNFTQELQKIIDLINDNDETTALAKFILYIEEISKEIGKYDATNWPVPWRKNIYKFGQLFKKSNHDNFIKELDAKIEIVKASANPENSEVLFFIKSEIEGNFFEDCSLENLKSIIKLYPNNPEFRNTQAYFLLENKNYEKAAEAYLLTNKIEPKNEEYVMHYFNTNYAYFNNLVRRGEIKKAREIVEKLKKFFKEKEPLPSDWLWKNHTLTMNDRLVDQETIKEKIDKIDSHIERKTDSIKNQFISIIGVFSAIVAFIITNVNIAISKLSLNDALTLMLAMGIILIIFMIVISEIFYHRRENSWNIFGEAKTWIAIVLIVILVLIRFL